MIVAAGYGHSHWMKLMRKLKEEGLLDLVYPEFFDDKKLLIEKRWTAYLRKLRRIEDKVKVAVWPDYCLDHRIRGKFQLEWVFPLHSKRELDFALKVADYIGFPNRDDLRDYTLTWFAEQRRSYGVKTWLLGLKPRYLKAISLFNACDVTTFSLPSFRYPRRVGEEEWRELLVLLRRRSGSSSRVPR